MIFQKQAFLHRPHEGQYGDCHRTAIACLLDLPRDQVPNFGEHYGDSEAFHAAEQEFLAERGLATVSVLFNSLIEDILQTMGAVNPRAYYLLGGMSRSGVGHTVIGLGGEIAWDPSTVEAGIVAPMDDGYYWITYLVPLCTVKEAR